MSQTEDPKQITAYVTKVLLGLALLVAVVVFTPLGGVFDAARADLTMAVGTYLQANPQSQSLDDALVGHWTFDGPDVVWSDTASEIKDMSGNGNDGNAVNINQSSAAIGKIGQAIDFNGSTSEIDAGSDVSIDDLFAGGGSLSVWFKADSWGEVGAGRILDKSLNTNVDNGYTFGISNSDGQGNTEYLRFFHDFSTQEGHWFTPNGSIDLGEWYHAVVTYDRGSTDNDPVMYLNGVAQTLLQKRGPSGSAISDSARTLYVGNRSNARTFDGLIDDARMYDRILTPEEVQSIYNEARPSFIASTPEPNSTLSDGLVGHWTFDGPDISWADSTTEIKDLGSSNTDGNALGSIDNNAVSTGRLGQALVFDGDSDYIDLPYSGLDFERTNPASYSVWVNIDPTVPPGGAQTILGRISPTRGTYMFWCRDTIATFCVDNGLGFQLVSTNGSGARMYTSGEAVIPNEWTHVVFTYSGNSNTSGMNIYVDGQSQSKTTSLNTLSGTIKPDINWRIGDDYTNDWFDGLMDDLRIYNRELSANEVAQLYRMGGGVTMTPCGAKTVTDADGNEYGTVQIGNQCWMAENLNVGTRISGATTQTDNATIEKWCYDNSDANCDTNNNPNNPDGGLYQWDEAMQYSTTEGAQGICPFGWHIPTDQEFKDLEIFLGMIPATADTTGFRGTDQGTKLKANGSSEWEGNLAGYGFSGSFFSRGTLSNWWSSSESGSNAWFRGLNSASVQAYRSQDAKTGGISVRCLRD